MQIVAIANALRFLPVTSRVLDGEAVAHTADGCDHRRRPTCSSNDKISAPKEKTKSDGRRDSDACEQGRTGP